MKRRLFMLTVFGILLVGSLGFSETGKQTLFIPDDADHDGVPDAVDMCPGVNASFFDQNGDGCIDDAIGARHTEFWMKWQMPFTYFINADGAYGVTDGSDFTAIQSGMSAWTAIPNVDFSVSYAGTTTQKIAAALDQVNLITFKDSQWPTYNVSNLVLALGISTSFTVDTEYNGEFYLPGQIVDADLLFNPSWTFKTQTAGQGKYDIRSIVTHEAGHLYGISHSPVMTSTMFYVLLPGTDAMSLEADDEEVFFKAYGDSTLRANSNRISGAVLDGQTSEPVPGAIVFAIDAANGDTVACDYTLPDGSYAFPGLADGSYYVAIHPIDESSEIGGLKTENVNALVDTTADKDFLQEYYDQNESSSDDAEDKLAVSVSGGSKAAGIDITTNVDTTPPEVVSITPGSNATSIKVDAAIVITFSEAMDDESITGNFSLKENGGSTSIGGTASFLKDCSVIAFTPATTLDFGTQYDLVLKTGLTDASHVGLAQPYNSSFTTEPMPPVAISSLSPSKGVVGSIVVISGIGFSWTPAENTVLFGSTPAEVMNAYPNRLVVRAPLGISTCIVTVAVGEFLSNEVTFTVSSETEVAKGFKTGEAELLAAPRGMTVLPTGTHAYVATDAGVAAVVVDPGIEDYLGVTSITVPGGLDAVEATPGGKLVYGISKTNGKLYAIDTDPSHVGFFNTVLREHAFEATPLGIAIEPSGRRAFVPIADGRIQVWDVKQGSATFEKQIGFITPPDLNTRGKMAFDPTGKYLLTLSGAGKLYVFDLGPDTLYATAKVLLDPNDVVVDPTGQHAYVSDGSGNVSIVPLSGLFTKTYDINTGGSLRALTVTPGGNYIYACNRGLNLIDVIDINEEGSSARSLVATIDLMESPVDIDLSPDGYYVFTAVGSSRQLVVTTIGLGPTLKSLSRRSGPPGTKLVLGGSGFGTTLEDIRVVFPSAIPGPPIEVVPEYSSGTSLTVTVPVNAGSGPITVIVDSPRRVTPEVERSNSLYFQVFGFLVPLGEFRCAGRIPTQTGYEVNPALELSPTGDFLVIGGWQLGVGGILGIFDADPKSTSFSQWINTFSTGEQPAELLALTPDGERVFSASANYSTILCHNMNRHSSGFGGLMGTIDLGDRMVGEYRHLGVSPDGELLLAGTVDSVYVIDIVPGSTNDGKVIGAVGSGTPMDAVDITFHPGGRYAYLANYSYKKVDVLCLDPTSADYLMIVASVDFNDPLRPRDVQSIAFEPDGNECLVLAYRHDVDDWQMLSYDTSDPANPVFGDSLSLGGGGSQSQMGVINVSPQGNRALAAIGGMGYIGVDLMTDPISVASRDNDTTVVETVDYSFSPDGSRIYIAGQYLDSLFVYDFYGEMAVAGRLTPAYRQAGVINQPLPVPLRVWVGDPFQVPELGVPGMTINFTVTSGGGYFTNSHLTRQMVATDAGGVAEIYWTLGPVVGEGTQEVTVTIYGMGPTAYFVADSYDDPENLPLRLVQTIPANTVPNVSVTSAVQCTFTRAVNPDSISTKSFFLTRTGETAPVPAIAGFAGNNQKVSLIPSAALEYSTDYTITATSGIRDMSDGQLENPGATTFTTAAKPPLMLTSIAPPAASVGASLVLSGSGFDATASNEKVLFNGAEVVPYEAGVDYVKAMVPLGAIPGEVRVVAGPDTSNAMFFTVLIPSTSPVDEVLATITTTNSVKSVAVTPDGALAYSVSPDGAVVIPIDVDGQTTYSSISVGQYPVAIAIDPEGRYAYVANFSSGSVSVIVVDPDSARFNQVVQTILVGTNPIDVAINPDGDRVYVANAGSTNISVIDGDDNSMSRHEVLATINTTNSVKSVAVTPDGAKVFAGTDIGYVIIDTQVNKVVANIDVHNSVKSVAVTPDGAFLIALTTEGKLLIIDIMPGSTQNTVLATITTTSGIKSVAVTPDGATLYVILDNSDKALVYSLTTIGSSGVLAPETPVPSPIVQVAVIDTITVGNDPTDIAFDPSGSGLMLICNAGDKTVTFYNTSSVPAGQIKAQIRVTPRTLNLQSRGRWVTGNIELPAPYWPEEIDIGSVLLQNAIPAAPGKAEFEDSDNDGLRELVLKFDRAAFQAILPQGEYVPVTITGMVRNRSFAGDDTIRTIRPVVKHPTNCVLTMGEPTTIEWTSPSGFKVDSVSVHWTPDDGASWIMLAHGIPDARSLAWQVPLEMHECCRVMVTLFSKGEILGMGMSQDPFMISVAVAVTVQAFAGALEDEAALLTWSTILEQNVGGFNLLRSESEAEGYEPLNAKLIASQGPSGGGYSFRDTTVLLNRTYYYELEEVSDRGARVVFGPYKLDAKAPFELGQNVPNPFNPMTTIRFTIPEDGHVRLAVYDASGRRVRTLVDGRLRADFYKVQWNGRNDSGRQVATGMYFYRIEAGRHVQSKKMLLLR